MPEGLPPVIGSHLVDLSVRTAKLGPHTFDRFSEQSLSELDRRPINGDAILAQHQVAELIPVGLSRRFMGATQALSRASQLLGNRCVYVHPEHQRESANR